MDMLMVLVAAACVLIPLWGICLFVGVMRDLGEWGRPRERAVHAAASWTPNEYRGSVKQETGARKRENGTCE